ncbi:hypothetical protein Fmac_021848 [Flemingia macrophylla]|uniref:5'-3' exoribonuclease n=1 Tax=Flemingia macrophylla TaxID=520843 RepID=A0ABD1LY14_9FABA
MGVPAFYRWLVEKYPKVVQDVEPVMQNLSLNFDNFYLDMNAIIHLCFHPDDHQNIPLPTTFEDVFSNVFNYIDRLVESVRPGKLLYMAIVYSELVPIQAYKSFLSCSIENRKFICSNNEGLRFSYIDGVAPRAKMNQQRRGRFQTAKQNELREAEVEKLKKRFKMEVKAVLSKQESQVSDPNIITPGTEFMHELSEALKCFISSRISSNSLWKNIMVILSDANVPGEGEHKIMEYIRKQRSLEEYVPDTRHCIYGNDADFIMHAMATHEPHVSLLIEDVSPQHQYQNGATKPFKFLHIWLLREYLEMDMKIEDPPQNCSIELERIIDDFIFMCFFAGNDFLPRMPSLEIHEGAVDLLMTVYKKKFNQLGGYLVDMSRLGEKNAAFVELSRVENFILMVGSYEEDIFRKRTEIHERKWRRLIQDYEEAKQEENNARYYSDLDDENSSDRTLLIKKASASKNLSGLVNIVAATPAEIEQNTEDLKDELRKCIREKSDLFKSGEFIVDKIKLGTRGFKERYYEAKFSVKGPTEIECKRKEIVQKYTEGLVWVLQYYFSEVASWAWFYPFHYGPFASDLYGMSQVRVKFEKGIPFSPLDQLLSVLPPASAHALPKAYAQLMLDEKSKILDFFPKDFEVDIEGKRFFWQGVCKLPWIDDKRLVAETRELRNELSENEAVRNSVKADILFVRSTSKLAEKVGFLSLTSKLDTRISDGIGGVISLCHEFVEKPCLGMESFDNKEERVLCVYYELPSTNHIPYLLSGVNLPEKSIFEGDIMETELWHERKRYYSCFDRVQDQGNWRSENKSSTSRFFSDSTSQHARSFLSNAPPVIYKEAGVGWSSGRGKRIDTMSNERSPLPSPFHDQHKEAGSYPLNTTRDTRPQHLVDNFRHFRISDNHLPRHGGSHQFRPHNNSGYMNQPTNASFHQGSRYETVPSGQGQGRGVSRSSSSEFRPYNNNGSLNQSTNASNYHQGSQFETVPFGRGRGRGISSNSISLRPQWLKSNQMKDQNRCKEASSSGLSDEENARTLMKDVTDTWYKPHVREWCKNIPSWRPGLPMPWDPPASTVEYELLASNPILAEPISAAPSTAMVAADETPQYVTLDTFNRFKDELDAKLDATLDSKLEKFFHLFASRLPPPRDPPPS